MSQSVILQNVKTTDERSIDIKIENHRIADIVPAGQGQGDKVVDFEHKVYVSSGWVDLHVHAFPEFEPYGDEADEIGYKTGVTTIVDAGSTGADRLADLIDMNQKAKTNVLAFLNISRIGLQRIDELSDLSLLDGEKLKKCVAEFGEHIVGLKARISKSVVGGNGIQPLKKARQFSNETGLPLMVHIGSGPPHINEVLDLLEENDVITHYLNGKANSVFDENGEPLPELLEAIQRGVQLDVGHGNASFSFVTAEFAKKAGIPFNSISTDIYRKNRLNGPVFNMANVLSKFLYLGYSLKEVIDGVTRNPAKWLKRPELGRIAKGDTANLTLFTVEEKETVFRDSEGEERKADQLMMVKGVVINGEYIEC
ncbi:amidohydrolase/deacetylase family metallohydrolase [Metabacillus sp. GX 13764]|uniref:amidohydrolase/deacetylase family metallohydrolase n=1 Tax=Metabacillus kandeliae TaxID=2900151 RepID=UPI001E34E77B|nr:amidohydrolase/deacetylase family metallohydrolase [Metabacillus kandeliae]MCD7034556.1 amidohydrolase/deacetylase family metallohydrolase [Metabacillus kandeliae]